MSLAKLSHWLVLSLCCLLLNAICFPAGLIAQEERILRFDSQITVQEDGTLQVQETLVVNAAGDRIQRGIYRDFPTLYRSQWLVQVEVPFEVESVTRNGQPEAFHVRVESNGKRVYFGKEEVQIPAGQHTYVLTYTTNFQLGHFDQHDELYWNVTGNGWDFPIDSAAARVQLPDTIPRDQITHEGYTGPMGSKARDLTSRIEEETGDVLFQTTRPLGSQEGLTIVVGFPKGYVQEPTIEQKQQLYQRANRVVLIAVAGMVLVAIYYLVVWGLFGVDPPSMPAESQFEPPENLTPACARYLWKMGYDQKCLTVTLFNMAVKRYLIIEEDQHGGFSLKRQADARQASLSLSEQLVGKTLLGSGTFLLQQINHKKLQKAMRELETWLSMEYEGRMFLKNRYWLIPGWLLSGATLGLVAAISGWSHLPLIAFMTVWTSFWTLGCVALIFTAITSWKVALNHRRDSLTRIANFGGAFFMTLFTLPFIAVEIFAMGVLIYHSSLWVLIVFVFVLILGLLFWNWIKQPTLEGQRLRDQIEGFRRFLASTEQDELEYLHPPTKTPELFEQYLPYAMALDVESTWADKFTTVLSVAATAEGQNRRPAWYRSPSVSGFTTAAVVGAIGSSLGTAISSASSAPGSSSGGGGRGSSGGGGGGGGGGGW